MARKKEKKLCQIAVRQDRLSLTRTAAEYLSEFVDLYEFGNMLALKGNAEGRIRLAMGSHRYRQNIRTREVVDLVRKKYECEVGDILTAWVRDDALIFSKWVTPEEAKSSFVDNFQKVEIKSRPPEPYSIRMRSHITSMSGRAGCLFKDRLTVYEYGELVAFVPDSNGGIQPVIDKDGRTRSIHSKELTDFLRTKYCVNGTTLPGWEKDGILFFANCRSALRIPFDKDIFTRHEFRMNMESVTINILQNSRLLVSSLGASMLETHVNLYECGDTLALVNDPDGEFKIIHCSNRAGCDITGRDLVKYIKEKLELQGSTNIISATIRANVVYFSKRVLDYIPAFKRFQRVCFKRVCSQNIISVTITPTGNGRIYISKPAREYLTGAISAYHKGNIWALAEASDGNLHMSSTGFISSRDLAQLIQSELQFERIQQFYMKLYNGKVFFSDSRLQDEDDLKIGVFEKVM